MKLSLWPFPLALSLSSASFHSIRSARFAPSTHSSFRFASISHSLGSVSFRQFRFRFAPFSSVSFNPLPLFVQSRPFLSTFFRSLPLHPFRFTISILTGYGDRARDRHLDIVPPRYAPIGDPQSDLRGSAPPPGRDPSRQSHARVTPESHQSHVA